MTLDNAELLLLVEDDDVDAMMMERTIRRLRPELRVVRAANGIEALEMIERDQPDLVVMDVRMPMMDGKEALSAIKGNDKFRQIPVVMMSTSEANEDVEYCYRHYSNAYLVKPVGADNSIAIIDKLLHFWFEVAKIKTPA